MAMKTGMRVRMLLPVVLLVLGASVLLADVRVGRLDGKPEFSEGDALGYFLWKDGDTWKLRWMTFGADHRFSGRVTVEGGEFRRFKRIDVDTERRLIAPGRRPRVVRGVGGRVRGVAPGRAPVVASRTEDSIEQETEHLIRFSTRTDDDLDGLDFQVTDDAAAVSFVLQIDGEPRPAEVEVGRDNFKPRENPLVVRVRP
jgi:hypothetical protein